MTELPWISKARQLIGLRETIGDKHNPILMSMLTDMGKYSGESRAWWADDETPWCGLFVGWCLGESDRYVIPEWFRAREWDDRRMTKLNIPAYGSIMVMPNHVGFVVGKNANGSIMLLGGNQNNSVSIAPFKANGNLGYMWPSFWSEGKHVPSRPAYARYELPLLKGNNLNVTTR